MPDNSGKLNNAYEECARDRPCDRTTTCRKARCQSLTDRMKDMNAASPVGTIGLVFLCASSGLVNKEEIRAMKGKRKTFGDSIGAGAAVILVYESGIGDSRHPFWAWLLDEGFHLWLNHGNYGMNWIFINLNSMICAPGMPGIRVAASIREHAVTVDEFKTIWQIFTKYEGLSPLVMPEEEPAGVKLIMSDEDGKTQTADLTRSDWDKFVLHGQMPPPERRTTDENDSWSTKYIQALLERKTPFSLTKAHDKLLEGKSPAEQREIRDRLALEIVAEYPYKTLIELDYREDLREKHIDERNWLKHLDEMTDGEITFMMEQLPGKNGLNANRRLHPEIPDRIRAEFLRDF